MANPSPLSPFYMTLDVRLVFFPLEKGVGYYVGPEYASNSTLAAVDENPEFLRKCLHFF